MRKGQALVEMAVALPFLLMIIVVLSDLLPLGANALISKSLTARGARAAALSTRPDGVTSCQTRVASAMDTTPLYLSDWSWEASGNCSGDSTVGIAQGEKVTVSIDMTFHATWFGDLGLYIETEDYGR